MKKFLALLFVCAGLTAMAVNPHVNMNAKVVNGKPAKAMVLKSNTLSNQLSAPVMSSAKFDANAMTPQRFFADRGVNPSNNKLLKKAPRRIGDDEILANKLFFGMSYSYNADSAKVVMDRNYYFGGWNAELEKAEEENAFNAYLYFTSIPFTINVDYNAMTAEMVMENLGGWQWSDTTNNGRFTTICDTTEYLFIWDENYILDNSEDAAPANLQGTVYEDGTIYFPDGWTLYVIDYTNKKVINTNSGQVTESADTTAGLLCGFIRSNYLITANATHDYDYPNGNKHYQNDAYMYQYDDTTAIVWNLWQFGSRGVEMYIHEDGTMLFPAYQIVGTGDIDDLQAQYSSYDWETAGYYYLNCDTASTSETGDTYGTVTANTIEWPATEWHRLCYLNGTGYVMSYYPMTNNVLTFTNGDQFVFPTEPEGLRGDVNDDKAVNIQDVTALIDFLLSGDFDSVNYDNSDANLDGTVNIQDVTALIDYLLSGVWPAAE